ncbi:MAG: phosphomannomutase/phosphoglucomutase, partial [Kiritimatiellaeota bacterium]|nr:phosphomannomutase/phosphoglucomutase [Kiritimatiellota bacterium]
MSIFKEYDIRGIYGTELTDALAYDIGRAVATFLACKRVAVGRDVRPHSEPLFRELALGLTEAGCDVLDLGWCSTPESYFGNATLGCDAGVMITASHNAKEYNGFKLSRAHAMPISGATGIKEIGALCETKAFSPKAATPGKIIACDIAAAYRTHVQKLAKLARPLHIAADFANGMGISEARAFAGLPITMDTLYGEFDGSFPNHEGNPLHHETLRDLQAMMRQKRYDFGVAFDGDADRAGFLDEHGEIIPMDMATALMAQEILATHPGGTVFYDLRSSWAVKEAIAAAGGTPMMSRVGHAFIKQQ